jgi:hypothetical protein
MSSLTFSLARRFLGFLGGAQRVFLIGARSSGIELTRLGAADRSDGVLSETSDVALTSGLIFDKSSG